MNRYKKKRLYLFLATFAIAALATFLLINVINQSAAFLYTPSDILKGSFNNQNQKLRVGGLVKPNSLQYNAQGMIERFVITDLEHEITANTINYQGNWPSLFKQGKGVVVEGTLSPQGEIITTLILAKHDENYIPASVKKQMEEKGLWRGQDGP